MSKVILLFGAFLVVSCSSLSGQKTWRSMYADLKIENDVFYLPIKTDQYFTSGLSLEIGQEEMARSPLLDAPSARRQRYWRLTQDIFTPQRIESPDLVANDRPFASFLVFTFGKSFTDDHLGVGITQEFTGGVLGKYSGGGKMQNAFHDMLSFADQLPGWRYEVKPDVIVNYQLGLRHSFRTGRFFWLNANLTARLGTLNTDLSPGLSAEWLALRLSPSRTLRFELSGQAWLVGYNATLTGGVFNADERYRGVIQTRRLVGQAGFDWVIDFDALRISGGLRHLSSEFHGGREHAWAWVSFRYQPGWRTIASRRSSRP